MHNNPIFPLFFGLFYTLCYAVANYLIFSMQRILNSKFPTPLALIIIAAALIFAVISFFFFKDQGGTYSLNLSGVPVPGETPFTYGEQPALSNPNFFAKVRQQLVDQSADFIEADLSAMKLHLYQKGQVVLDVPIESKGRVGSWWETPSGLYKVLGKEKAHFSSIGHVYMPWSMNFQGNFFIHGNTYYPDGTPTSKEFTGGCIRLSTADAKKVYDAIEPGVPVLVYEKGFVPDDYVYKSPSGPDINATSYLAADLSNNHVFAIKDADKQVPIASITKLMTALITIEYINLDNSATVPPEAIVFTSKARLKAGEKYRIYELLFPLLMESSNEAAETISRYFGRNLFVERMNEKAAAIGMAHTHFVDASGAGAENVSTAADLFMLAKYIYNDRSFIWNITSGKLKGSAYDEPRFTDLGNYNDFINNPYFVGGKNGKTTAAAETNISVFAVPVDGGKRPVVTIVLGAPNEKQEAGSLIDYTLNYIKSTK
jgi:hypothetical protein